MADAHPGSAVVEPGAALSPERAARYSRQLLLPGFGELGQRRLANARVLVVGGGGLGSACIPYLASAGVGTIGVVDPDAVELSNLHRQVVHGVADVGRSKADSIADTVAAIDPEVTVVGHRMWLDSSTIDGILSGYDLVVDGSDNFATRYLTDEAAARSYKPLVWGAVLRYDGQAGVAFAGRGPTYRDLFPDPPADGEVLSCALGGVLPSVCAVIGAVMSAEVIKLITGIGQPLIGRVITYDALTGRFREVDYQAADYQAADVGEPSDESRTPGDGRVSGGVPGQAGGHRTTSRAGGPLPAAERSVGPVELLRRIRSGEPMQLVDVREPFEAAIASIEGSELIPLGELEQSLHRIRPDVPVVIYCHHGPRAARAAEILHRHGYHDLQLLDGGVDAFAVLADPTLARY